MLYGLLENDTKRYEKNDCVTVDVFYDDDGDAEWQGCYKQQQGLCGQIEGWMTFTRPMEFETKMDCVTLIHVSICKHIKFCKHIKWWWEVIIDDDGSEDDNEGLHW